MVVLITGGSGSGKSAYAEHLITHLCEHKKLYYLATMRVLDVEGQRKIEAHRRMRAGKGFHTLEYPVDIGEAVHQIEPETAVLLECISNLTANEMFGRSASTPAGDGVVRKIIKDIRQLAEKTAVLVIVTNNVFEDGVQYDSSTKEYVEVLGRINEELALLAVRTVEVTAGMGTNWKNAKEQEVSEDDGTSMKGMGMDFYFGGTSQGKLHYVMKRYPTETYIVVEGETMPSEKRDITEYLNRLTVDRRMILNHFHLWVRRCMEEGEQPEQLTSDLLKRFPDSIIICDEIGSGIVPIDAFEREYREQVGRIQCQLAERAERVERILCGMGQRLK